MVKDKDLIMKIGKQEFDLIKIYKKAWQDIKAVGLDKKIYLSNYVDECVYLSHYMEQVVKFDEIYFAAVSTAVLLNNYDIDKSAGTTEDMEYIESAIKIGLNTLERTIIKLLRKSGEMYIEGVKVITPEIHLNDHTQYWENTYKLLSMLMHKHLSPEILVMTLAEKFKDIAEYTYLWADIDISVFNKWKDWFFKDGEWELSPKTIEHLEKTLGLSIDQIRDLDFDDEQRLVKRLQKKANKFFKTNKTFLLSKEVNNFLENLKKH